MKLHVCNPHAFIPYIAALAVFSTFFLLAAFNLLRFGVGEHHKPTLQTYCMEKLTLAVGENQRRV